MGIRVIAFGMVFILVALFLYLRLFEKKLKRNSLAEAHYAEAILTFKEDNDLEKCIATLCSTLSISQNDAMKLLKKDKVIE